MEAPEAELRAINQRILSNVTKSNHIKIYISLSTVAVYGSCIDSEWNTYRNPNPDSVYGAAKLALEKEISKAFKKSQCQYYILRLGHVYGPEQWLSSYIVSELLNNNFGLPFDGKLDSNSIHIDELAAALSWLIKERLDSGVYNLASFPQKSWRQVFNWHSDALDLGYASSMTDLNSTRLLDIYRSEAKRKIFGKAGKVFLEWLKGMSPLGMARSMDIKVAGNRLLDSLPGLTAKKIKAFFTQRMVNDLVSQINSQYYPAAILLCDSMPGPYIEPYFRGEIIEKLQSENLRKWFLKSIRGPL